ncbi:porin [Photobacterium sanguinicancri]|uniref:Porin n=1 Tax=Photobacterium sanguinicancri TaxID=875932 RepID=A0AAW7Y8D2_9GAMM|nr:porin [Photobacterium sanguinicancri]MDO6542920.1 porin [Photobacterium sanguinicancri]OZS44027.1 porin [Photobacterium sanguinicancri]
MKLKLSAVLIPTLLLAGQASAITVYEDDQTTFDVGGVFVLDAFQPKWGDDEIFSAGRSILNFGFERQLTADTSIDAKLEWDQFLNSPSSGKSNFRNRLGYVTVKNDALGSLRFGKQWSAYHDVARYMDNMVIIDPDATPIYSEGTDGGFAATGRGDNLAAYRYSKDGLNVSAHYGFTSTDSTSTADVKRDHNIAASTSYDFDFGLSLGAAYLENKVSVDNTVGVNGLKDGDKQTATTVGGQYVRGGLKVATAYTKGEKIHKAGLLGGASTAEWADADAFDVYAHYVFESGFRPFAYASNVNFKEDARGISGDRQVYALGLAYSFTPETILTFEAKQNKLNEFNADSSKTDNGGGFNFVYSF